METKKKVKTDKEAFAACRKARTLADLEDLGFRVDEHVKHASEVAGKGKIPAGTATDAMLREWALVIRAQAKELAEAERRLDAVGQIAGGYKLGSPFNMAHAVAAGERLLEKYEAIREELRQLKAIKDRPFDGDNASLQGRAETDWPLSLADTNELAGWLDERDGRADENEEEAKSAQDELARWKLDFRQMSTVLAALRYWQRYAPTVSAGTPELAIATNGGEVERLTNEEIDELCERLNCGGGAINAQED